MQTDRSYVAHEAARSASGDPVPTQGAKDGRTYVHAPYATWTEKFGAGAGLAYESFSAGGEEFDSIFSRAPNPSSEPKPWEESTAAPIWEGDSLAGPVGWTRAPLTNAPEYDSSTAIRAGWNSTLVQDDDNFLLADPSDVNFQDFQNSFFR
jgi:hypothetical protein